MVTMKKKIDGEMQNRRIHLYSGHDSSIIPLMVALGVTRLDVPLVMPGSALLLELHEDTLTRKHSVKVAVTAHHLQTFFSNYNFINSTIPHPVFTLSWPCLFQSYIRTKPPISLWYTGEWLTLSLDCMFVCVGVVYRRWVGRAESATCHSACQWLRPSSEQQPLALRSRLRQGVSSAWLWRWPHQPEQVDLITSILHYDTLSWNYWQHKIKEHLFYPS